MLKRSWMIPVFAMVGLLAAGAGTAVLKLRAPKVFESSATLEIKEAPADMNHEISFMQSQPVLQEAVRRGGFVGKWDQSEEEAVKLVRRSISFRSVERSGFVTIRGRHHDREEVRVMVMAVAQAYREQRKARQIADSKKTLEALSDAVRRQEEVVEQRRKKLADIMKNSENPREADMAPAPAPAGGDPVEAPQ